MAEVADKCIINAVNATDQYSKWASAERAKNIRASIKEIERMELSWCNGGTFEREYQVTFPIKTKEEIRLRELAEVYHTACEEYDRTICTGRIKDGVILPATGAEVAEVSRHARIVRDVLWRQAAQLGFSHQQWLQAIMDVGDNLNGQPTRKTNK